MFAYNGEKREAWSLLWFPLTDPTSKGELPTPTAALAGSVLVLAVAAHLRRAAERAAEESEEGAEDQADSSAM